MLMPWQNGSDRNGPQWLSGGLAVPGRAGPGSCVKTANACRSSGLERRSLAHSSKTSSERLHRPASAAHSDPKQWIWMTGAETCRRDQSFWPWPSRSREFCRPVVRPPVNRLFMGREPGFLARRFWMAIRSRAPLSALPPMSFIARKTQAVAKARLAGGLLNSQPQRLVNVIDVDAGFGLQARDRRFAFLTSRTQGTANV